MTAAPDPQASLAVALSELRGEIRTGLADIKGSLAVLVERTNRTDADVRQLREDMGKEIEAVRAELEEFKKGRWPLAQIGALLGVGALVAAIVALFVN